MVDRLLELVAPRGLAFFALHQMRLMLNKIAALGVGNAQHVIVADRADVASRFEQIVDKRINRHKLVIDNLPALAISPLFE